MSKQPSPAPTAIAVGPYPPVIHASQMDQMNMII